MKWVNRKSFIKSELHFQPRSHGELSRSSALPVIGSLLAFGSWLSQRIVVVSVARLVTCHCLRHTFGKGKKLATNSLAALLTGTERNYTLLDTALRCLPVFIFFIIILLHFSPLAIHRHPCRLPFSLFSYFFSGCSFSFQLTFLHSMFSIPEFLFALRVHSSSRCCK